MRELDGEVGEILHGVAGFGGEERRSALLVAVKAHDDAIREGARQAALPQVLLQVALVRSAAHGEFGPNLESMAQKVQAAGAGLLPGVAHGAAPLLFGFPPDSST